MIKYNSVGLLRFSAIRLCEVGIRPEILFNLRKYNLKILILELEKSYQV